MQTSLVLVVFVTLCACFNGSYAIPGGLSDADKNDATVVIMANFAVSEIGSEYTLVSIKRAQTQVVHGIMYHLKLDVKRRKTGKNVAYSCKAKVLEQNWLDNRELVEFHCTK